MTHQLGKTKNSLDNDRIHGSINHFTDVPVMEPGNCHVLDDAVRKGGGDEFCRGSGIREFQRGHELVLHWRVIYANDSDISGPNGKV